MGQLVTSTSFHEQRNEVANPTAFESATSLSDHLRNLLFRHVDVLVDHAPLDIPDQFHLTYTRHKPRMPTR